MFLFALVNMALADSVSPDRPTASIGATTMAQSVGQLELGLTGQADFDVSPLMVNGLFRYGIGDSFEIRLDSSLGLDGSSLYLSPGVKWTAPAFVDAFDLGLALHPILPIERDFALFAMALANVSFDAFSLSINAGGGVETGGAVEFIPQASVVFGYQQGAFSPFIEVVSVLDNGFESTLGVGVIWSNSSLAFDIAAYVDPSELGEQNSAYQALMGFTYRFKGE